MECRQSHSLMEYFKSLIQSRSWKWNVAKRYCELVNKEEMDMFSRSFKKLDPGEEESQSLALPVNIS
jgi:hypothetical protein